MTSFALFGPSQITLRWAHRPRRDSPQAAMGEKGYLPETPHSREELRKRQWRIHRHFRAAADGAQRWDQAYQHLLEWAQQRSPRNGVPLLASPPTPDRRKTMSTAIYVRVSTERRPKPKPLSSKRALTRPSGGAGRSAPSRGHFPG